MRKIINFIKGIIISVWVLIALVTTILLLSYNNYSVSELGKYSVIIMDNNDLSPTFKENDVVITKKDSESSYKVGDNVFFYLDNPEDAVFVNFGEITKIVSADHAEDTFYFGDTKVSYGSIIGKGNGAVVYHNIGLVLTIFESKWGFMFLVILPALFATVYEIFAIIDEAKKDIKEEEKKENLKEEKNEKE